MNSQGSKCACGITCIIIKKKRRICRCDWVPCSWKAWLQAKHLHQMFAVWSVDSADQRTGRQHGEFRWGGGKQTKNPWSSLLLVLQDERTDGPHPKTQALLFPLLSSRRLLNCNNSEHSLSKYLHPNAFVLLCYLQRDTHNFPHLKIFKWLFEKVGASVKIKWISFKVILHQSSH